MNRQLTLGSLFDGSGGFPLGAVLHGIKPVWASEVEPFPIRVTTKRFPQMKHYGDISKMNGTDIEPVDIITFGSPCTNLSVAGRREGLDGEQSSLFYEAIRIIKEMRCATDGKYPRWICWENVPGAFSSNKGDDFRAVLSSIVQIIEPKATVPAADKNGWPYADILLGDGWSIAYRVLDAKHFGVPQRRKRIYLVADFAGSGASDILFERHGVSRDFAQGFGAGQAVAGGSENRTGDASGCIVLNDQGGSRMDITDGITCTLRAEAHHPPCVMEASGFCTEHSAQSRGVGYEKEKSPTLRAGVVPGVAIENHPADSRVKICEDGIVPTLSSRMGTGGNNVPLTMSIAGNIIDRTEKSGGNGLGVNKEVSFTLNTADRHAVAYSMTTGGFAEVHEEEAATLMARDYKDPQTTFVPQIVNQPQYLVRRLTPLECCRLQGFPDGWCDGLETTDPTEKDVSFWADIFDTCARINGKKPKSRNQIIKWLRSPHTDSAEYKMWGNGVALPCVCFVMAGIAEAADIESLLAITPV